MKYKHMCAYVHVIQTYVCVYKYSIQSQEGPSKIPTTSTSSQPLGHLEEVKEEGLEEEGEGDEGEGDVEAEEREGDMEGEEMEGEEDGEEDNWIEEEREWKQKHKYRKQSPPPLIKHLSTSPIARYCTHTQFLLQSTPYNSMTIVTNTN